MAKEKILIVDDDPDITKAMKAALVSVGYSVMCAGDTTDGMDILKIQKPDMIILDVMMRTVDEGFEMAKKIKKDVQYKDIPILMFTAIKQITGFNFKAIAGDPEWLPVDEFLEKPAQIDMLLEKVKSLLNKKTKRA
jgi:CheY-like chemotaxis protein